MIQSIASNCKGPAEQESTSRKAIPDSQTLMSIIDKALRHLNHMSEANITAQQLYIQLLKEKKTMKYDQIKKIYRTLTEGKAKQILFEHDRKELVETDYQNHEGLIRVCWRSLQKIVKKITYYMINENHLSVISKNVHLNQQFVRRFQKLKSSSMLFILEIIQKLIEQNSILQKKIYDILLNRGYVVSLDQFYKLNGCDAEHRQAYNAKDQDQNSNSSSQQQIINLSYQLKGTSSNNSRKQTFRKKKRFRLDHRYSWKQNIQINQIQDKEKYPINKTNFQIREGFEKFIGDFLQNQSLNEILIKYKFEEYQQFKPDEQKHIKKQGKHHKDSIIHKKIFETKIESVLSQLKMKNVKVSQKPLQIIENSSNLAISNKINFGQKKSISRKNNQRRQSVDLITGKRRNRDFYVINDRKIVNENFFRQLLRRNTNIQNFINQEILLDTEKIKMQLQNSQNSKIIFNVIKFSQKQLPFNHSKQISKFAVPIKKNSTFPFNDSSSKQNNIDNVSGLKRIDKNQRFFQTELNFKYKIDSRKNTPGIKNESVTQKIRILNQESELKNQRSILEAIQNATIDPANPLKFAQTLKVLNRKRNFQINPAMDEFKDISCSSRAFTPGMNEFKYISGSSREPKTKSIKRYKTQMGQRLNSEMGLTVKQIDLSKLVYSGTKKLLKQSKLVNRVQTQQNSARKDTNINTHSKLQQKSIRYMIEGLEGSYINDDRVIKNQRIQRLNPCIIIQSKLCIG